MRGATRTMAMGTLRSRWAAVGAAVAVTLGGGGLFVANAAPSVPSTVVAITPTRILDTRTDVGLVGPFVPGEAQKLQVTGSVPTQPPPPSAPANQVVVPPTATSVTMNVTVVGPLTGGFLSIRPGDATGSPATSNINFGAGGPNIANAVSVQLPAAGNIDIYVSGTVREVLIDVVGYTNPTTAGPPGPVGPAGPRGVSAWDEIPSGQTVTGTIIWDTDLTRDEARHRIHVPFPAKAPANLTIAQVNFAPDLTAITVDDDATCTGNSSIPTAPAGQVCIYYEQSIRVKDVIGRNDSVDAKNGFLVSLRGAGAPGDMFLYAGWAYTAP